MDALTTALIGAAGVAAAVLLQYAVVRGLRVALLAYRPLSGEHTDSALYERSLWTPGERGLLPVWLALIAAGLLAATALRSSDGPLWPALAMWAVAVGWDLWAWERVAASVKFVTWRRGWRKSSRRVAISDLREVLVVERNRPARGPAWLRPGACQLVLMLKTGKAVKMPRTGALLGGEGRVEDLANFVRLQMDVVADNRRRAAADKRAALRRALHPMAPAHPATKLDPSALPRG
ncbi:MAG: hypothetical protein H0W48_03590 [Methylibium sp.]|nr:hypothetical protein [Methylibium sp.]